MKVIAYNVVADNGRLIIDQFPTKKAAADCIREAKKAAKEDGAVCDYAIEPVR